MTFVSYAQNFEDVILHRALKHVDKGFYIDVGAQAPVIGSVTQAFYERGWRGINIEPVQQWYNRLQEARPKDLNLRIAVSTKSGKSRFFEVVDETGLSTLEEVVAERHAQQGYKVRSYDVLTRTLDSILDEHATREIHFLKIDVEGAEANVLTSIDLNRWRPWIVIVEATEPNSTIKTHERWQRLLTHRGYKFVYFDGLNRFFLADEQSELRFAFSAPPNVFDHFVSYAELQARQHVEALKTDLQQSNAHRQSLEVRLAETASELNAVYSSRSWRITYPLRVLSLLFRRVFGLSLRLVRTFQH